MTLADVAIEALCRPTSEPMTGKQKVERVCLALRIQEGDPVELKAEEIVTIKERIGTLMPPVVVWASYKLIDPPTP